LNAVPARREIPTVGLTNTIETAIETPQVGNVRLERWLESCH
jgi:hypothetical protein